MKLRERVLELRNKYVKRKEHLEAILLEHVDEPLILETMEYESICEITRELEEVLKDE